MLSIPAGLAILSRPQIDITFIKSSAGIRQGGFILNGPTKKRPEMK